MNWAPFQPDKRRPWNIERVVHLHRRAAFAVPWAQLQRDLKDGPELSVDRLLLAGETDRSEGIDGLTKAIGDAAVTSNNPNRLKAWWLYRMLTTSDPLGERLTLMWHNHFATSNLKVKNLRLMREQNELFRVHSRGSFQDLLLSVVKHPAMMIWLDADSNRKGKANENLAREMLELFTLGVGNYSENDVKESARALTGWTVINDQFEYRATRHDNGKLKILGKEQGFDGDQLIDLLMHQPETAKRIAWRLCRTFMSESFVANNSDAIVELAAGLMENDLDISWALEKILKSEAFFSDGNIRSKVLGPAEFVVGAIRSLELNEPLPGTIVLADWLKRMGLDLFYPPNVGGWREGRSWLGSRNVVARANFASALIDGKLWKPEQSIGLEQLIESHADTKSIDEKVHWLTTLLWGKAPESVAETIAEQAKDSRSPITTSLKELLSHPQNLLA